MNRKDTLNSVSQVGMVSGIDTLVDADGKVEDITLPVGGMSCASCVTKIEKGLSSVKGVLSAKVNLAT